MRPRPLGLLVIGLAVVALVAVIASLSLDDPNDEPIKITGAGEVQRVLGGIHQTGAELGSPDAPVTIELFNDLQCSTCDEYQLEVVPPLVEDLVRPGDAKLVYRHFPLGEKERNLADFGAVAAGEQDDQWQFVQLFFINQDQVPAKGVDEDFLSRVAAAVLEFDLNQWHQDFKDESIAETLDNDGELAAQLGLLAQPAALVVGPGGRKQLEDRPTAEEIEAAVEAVQ
ncbi:MAG: DsbA family protein [Solirubrobacterales bacterium]